MKFAREIPWFSEDFILQTTFLRLRWPGFGFRQVTVQRPGPRRAGRRRRGSSDLAWPMATATYVAMAGFFETVPWEKW